jgi:hypothetical protein
LFVDETVRTATSRTAFFFSPLRFHLPKSSCEEERDR